MVELSVSDGGTVAVETDALRRESARVVGAAHLLAGWAARVGALHERTGFDPAGPGELAPPAVRALLDSARGRLAVAAMLAEVLGDSLAASAADYERADHLAETGRRVAAFAFGLSAPPLAFAAASGIAVAAGPSMIASGVLSLTDGGAGVERRWRRLLEGVGLPLLSDPAFVAVVRAVADHADEFAGGLRADPSALIVGDALEAPENAHLMLGAAAALGTIWRMPVPHETPVRVDRVRPPGARDGQSSEAAAAPRGIGGLAERIPTGGTTAPNVRIERYGALGDARWVVYVGGTRDFGMVPADQPVDMSSNLHGVAAASSIPAPAATSGADRLVRDAMAQAGVAAGEPVVVIGHSAGGIVAANLAAEPEAGVVAAVSLGGPAQQVDTGRTPVLAVAHAEDLVPATGGSGFACAQRIDVGRRLGDVAPSAAEPIPAHALRAYRETADLIDESDDPRLAGFRDILDDVTRGEPAEVTFWRGRRTPAAETAAGAGGGVP
ncbi:hypothetical protein [Agromyces sp. SYSU T0242]|uniref:hypothetical protein n=1 Tax=Agromyces litoreus TaxID=3158561 RepID=UPI00339B9BEE